MAVAEIGPTSPLHVKIDEGFAKSLRDNAEEELGISENDLDDALDALIDLVDDAGVSDKYIESLGDSKFKEYYDRKQRKSGTDNLETKPGRKEEASDVTQSETPLRERRPTGSPRTGTVNENAISTGLQRTAVPEGRRSSPEKLKTALEKAGLSPLPKAEDALSRGDKMHIATKSKGDTALKNKVTDEFLFAKATEPNIKTKTRDYILDAISVPKSLKSSVDLSAAGRQGLMLTVAHPKLAGRAFLDQIKSGVSKAAYDRFKRDLDLHPYIELAEDSGLFLASLADENSLTEREEAFMSRLFSDDKAFKNNALEKARQLVTAPIRMSERAYVTFLDSLRIQAFTRLAQQVHAYNLRKGKEDTSAQYEGIAAFVNYATGRGDLGKFNDAAPYLNATFFSARYWASRLQVMNPVFYATLPPGARSAAMKDLAKYIGAAALTMLLMKLLGFKVEG